MNRILRFASFLLVVVLCSAGFGIAPSAFGRVWGQIDDGSGVMLEIPRASLAQAAVRVVGSSRAMC